MLDQLAKDETTDINEYRQGSYLLHIKTSRPHICRDEDPGSASPANPLKVRLHLSGSWQSLPMQQCPE